MEKPKAVVHHPFCLSCGGCISLCPQKAITMLGKKAYINKNKCNSCGICLKTCPVGAISWEDKKI